MDVEEKQTEKNDWEEKERREMEEQKQAESPRAAGCCTAGGSPGRGQRGREQQEVQRPQAEAEEPARTKLMGNCSDWLLPSREQGLEGQREGRAEVRGMGGHME